VSGSRNGIKDRRCGTAAVELVLLLPFLAMLFLFTVDFSRLYYHYSIVTNCARNGALYASDPTAAPESPYYNVDPTQAITNAALADASNLSPQPTVSSTNGVDANGNPYVEVTVSYSFATICDYPGLPNPISLSRTVQMRVVPTTPN
jgi:Flp pilus assembly protein TadG